MISNTQDALELWKQLTNVNKLLTEILHWESISIKEYVGKSKNNDYALCLMSVAKLQPSSIAIVNLIMLGGSKNMLPYVPFANRTPQSW